MSHDRTPSTRTATIEKRASIVQKESFERDQPPRKTWPSAIDWPSRTTVAPSEFPEATWTEVT